MVQKANAANQLITFSTEAYFILQERLAEQESQGVRMPLGIDRDELALRILIAAELTRR